MGYIGICTERATKLYVMSFDHGSHRPSLLGCPPLRALKLDPLVTPCIAQEGPSTQT